MLYFFVSANHSTSERSTDEWERVGIVGAKSVRAAITKVGDSLEYSMLDHGSIGFMQIKDGPQFCFSAIQELKGDDEIIRRHLNRAHRELAST